MTGDWSESPIGSYGYTMSKWSLSLAEIVEYYSLYASISALFLWFVICSLFPLISFWLVDAPIPHRFVVFVTQESPSDGKKWKLLPTKTTMAFIAFVCVVVILFVLYVVLDNVLTETVNFFTYIIGGALC